MFRRQFRSKAVVKPGANAPFRIVRINFFYAVGVIHFGRVTIITAQHWPTGR